MLILSNSFTLGNMVVSYTVTLGHAILRTDKKIAPNEQQLKTRNRKVIYTNVRIWTKVKQMQNVSLGFCRSRLVPRRSFLF